MSMTRCLEGTTVVSLEHAIAAPFCTLQLADQGARVIKVAVVHLAMAPAAAQLEWATRVLPAPA
jgi:crotonobetainyl-CoA:carnitine CoA-transferase CaiB-like acyl-CoA transferase